MHNKALIFLFGCWWLSHVAAVLLVTNRVSRLAVVITMTGLLLLVYLYKPYTYDLEGYSIYFDTGYIETLGLQEYGSEGKRAQLHRGDITGSRYHGYDVGFDYLIKTLRQFLPSGQFVKRFNLFSQTPVYSDPVVFSIISCALVLLLVSARNLFYWKESYLQERQLPVPILLGIPIILGSVFFFLGSQNTIRSFIGLTVVLLSISYVHRNQYILALLLIGVAATFHSASVPFGVFGCAFAYFVSQRRASNMVGAFFNIRWVEIYALGVGVATSIAIKVAAISGLMTSDLPYMDNVKQYIFLEEAAGSPERVFLGIKVLALTAVMVTTEIILGRKDINSDKFDIRTYRRCIYLFVIPLILYPEIFSRVLPFYFSIEMMFIIWALSSRQPRVRLAGAIVFMVYGIAPNVLNVLAGSGFYHSF